ncbi:MAG: hypothetical protein PVH88_24475 [Ignavibacteria bacterium]
MKIQDIVIAHPKTTEEVNALKAFLQALKIKFEISKARPDSSGKSPYNPEFVAKIKKSKKEFEDGKFKRVDMKDLQKFLGV